MVVPASQSLKSVLHEFSSTDVGEEEYSIIHFQPAKSPNIKIIPRNQIYKQTLVSRVNVFKDYRIKTAEETFALENKQKDIFLLSRDAIRRHRSKYKFLHIGLVQVSISRRFQLMFDTRMLVCLRDSKHLSVKESILAAFESDVLDGAIKFNWFPNFSSPLPDLAKSNGLVVSVEPYGSDGGEGFQPFTFKCRVCYKLMKTSPEPKSLFDCPVLELNTEKTNVVVPKVRNQK